MISAVLRRIPILWVLVLGVCCTYLVINYNQQKLVVAERYRQDVLNREKDLILYTKIGEQLGEKNLWDELYGALEEARLQKRLDIYLVTFQGQTLWFGEKNGDLKNVEAIYPTGFVNTLERSFITSDIQGGYRLTVGIEKDFAAFKAAQAPHFMQVVLEQQIHILFIILLVGFWTLKDLVMVVREFRKGKRGSLKNVKINSAETAAFVNGLTGYAQAVDDLQEENRKLGRQVLPSLQKEMYSGRKPPYDFHCTMVRTDINRFSVIFNTHNVSDLMATINEFFDEVSKIVARYGGLVHEFVGDEVIYYFKDDDHGNSFAIALAAVRDINEAATRFNEATLESRGYPFTVKSSLAHGKVRFGPLVNGFTVAGSVLIETVRILSYIHEKDENVVFFDGAHETKLGAAISSKEVMRVTLKGYQSEIGLHQYSGHSDLNDYLNNLSEQNVDLLLQYRSDEQLATTLMALRLHVKSRPLEVTLRAVNGLRAPYIASTKIDFASMISEWIQELVQQSKSNTFDGADKVLSAVVKLYANLVLKSSFKPAHREQLRELLQNGDRRVVANTVEVLTHFAVEVDGRALRKSHREDLRITANAIILEGSLELDGHVMKKLTALVKSKKPTEIASGLYALGELAMIHRLRDPAYFASQADFSNLTKLLETYAQHITTSVRRQALIAARKIDDEALIDRIHQQIVASGSDLMAEEFRRYLRESSQRPAA